MNWGYSADAALNGGFIALIVIVGLALVVGVPVGILYYRRRRARRRAAITMGIVVGEGEGMQVLPGKDQARGAYQPIAI